MTKKYNIPFSPPDISELEISEVCEALRSGWITTGPKVKELEKRIAHFLDVPEDTPNCVCLNSQTACAELSLRVLGIGPQDGGSSLDEVMTAEEGSIRRKHNRNNRLSHYSSRLTAQVVPVISVSLERSIIGTNGKIYQPRDGINVPCNTISELDQQAIHL